GAIGEENRPVGMIVGGDGVLSATAAQGIYVAGAGGALKLGAVNSGGSVVITSAGDLGLAGRVDAGGDVTLSAVRAITGEAGGLTQIAGRNVTLTADQGGIGAGEEALVVEASGILNASAEGDIDLEDR